MTAFSKTPTFNTFLKRFAQYPLDKCCKFARAARRNLAAAALNSLVSNFNLEFICFALKKKLLNLRVNHQAL